MDGSDLLPAVLDGVVERKTCDLGRVLPSDDLEGLHDAGHALSRWKKW